MRTTSIPQQIPDVIVGLTFYSGLPHGAINWALKYAPDSILNVSGRAVGQTRALRQADPILRSPGGVPRPRCSPQRGEDINLIQLNKADGATPPGREAPCPVTAPEQLA